ncbi:MAG: hypothetical protein J2P17_23945 [Mycobacterium sp.]|nr:hypothetical protein [Mycobacterium sp.]
MSTGMPAPAGVTWDEAMNTAAEILKGLGKGSRLSTPEFKAQLAQAWVAYARELTMRARAGGTEVG